MAEEKTHIFLCFFLFYFLITFTEVEGNGRRDKKLFVFGDSYADTGNNRMYHTSSWHTPYGLTFPGKPAGRFSDGRVLTDFLASYLGIKSPITYQMLKMGKTMETKNGVNFAYGGSGVFKTLIDGPNLTTQVNFFHRLVVGYTKSDLKSSVALVSLAGNDYATFGAEHEPQQKLKGFTKSIINQLAINLKRIHKLGVPKIWVTAIEPLGCLPSSTLPSSYSNCIKPYNSIAMFHNHLLTQAVKKLNEEFRSPVFFILDLYSAFTSSLKSLQSSNGRNEVGNPLRPCCVGVSSEYSCGSIDKNGTKMYVVCKNPKLSFFWDQYHPSQNAVRANGVDWRPGNAKLFVFGDSYADTGNTGKSKSTSWLPPSGITFPGKPSGRFSDGRVLTDYIASHMGIRTPLPHKLLNVETKLQLKNGVNFAYGGTGVFKTFYDGPNMTSQIDYFHHFIIQQNYTKLDLASSVALVSLAGNDYTTFVLNGGQPQDVNNFTISIINQLAINLKRIHELGVPKVGITAIEPMGCLPSSTILSSYSNCSDAVNAVATFHNHILNLAVHKLNLEFPSKSPIFVIVDLYSSFIASLKRLQRFYERHNLGSHLKPCCRGVSSGYSCGSVHQNGTKMYVVCPNRRMKFFWDADHPSQFGWHHVVYSLRSSLRQLY